jgi:hypothetical protein
MVTGKRVHSALNTYVRSPLTNPLVRKGLCTWQSKIEWKMDGNVVTTRKHIIKQKRLRCFTHNDTRYDAHPAVNSIVHDCGDQHPVVCISRINTCASSESFMS